MASTFRLEAVMRVGPHNGIIRALIRVDYKDLSLSPLCEDTVGRQLSISQGQSSHQKPTMLVP